MGVSIYNPTSSTLIVLLNLALLVYRLIILFFLRSLFCGAEKIKLKSTKFMAKNWEELITATPIKFNSNYITLNKDSSIIFN